MRRKTVKAARAHITTRTVIPARIYDICNSGIEGVGVELSMGDAEGVCVGAVVAMDVGVGVEVTVGVDVGAELEVAGAEGVGVDAGVGVETGVGVATGVGVGVDSGDGVGEAVDDVA